MGNATRAVLIFACLLAFACAGETQERPPRTEPTNTGSSTRTPSPPPITESAFEPPSHSESRTVPIRDDRFATRRIGEEGSSGPRRFGGARVDLDLKGADVHDVFRLLADVGKVNIVVAGEVSGTITMRLKQVPWDQALDVIVKARGLTYEREGNVILVRTMTPSPSSGATK
jgi:type IV pilus assembly protein PilQ